MALVYKLTDMGLYTYNDTQWGQEVEHTAPGGGGMCSNRWLHAYRSPELAAFMNPIHANFADPVLWACDGDIGADDGAKIGCTRLKTIGTVAMPQPTTLQRVAF
jgi:hypothetical protein